MASVKLLFVGHGRCGKDEAGIWFGRNTTLKFAGTTSKYLCPFVAEHLGIPEHEAYQKRHDPGMREVWWDIGKRVRFNDPGVLLRTAFANGDVSGGVRDYEEAVRAHEHCDLVVWINRDVPVDPTVEFDSSMADIVIENLWGLPEYHRKLEALAKCLGVMKGVCRGQERSCGSHRRCSKQPEAS
jgi:hypothetical protein